MPKSTKLADLEITETSGVDHPAHLAEGWIVMKSEDLDEALASELFQCVVSGRLRMHGDNDLDVLSQVLHHLVVI